MCTFASLLSIIIYNCSDFTSCHNCLPLCVFHTLTHDPTLSLFLVCYSVIGCCSRLLLPTHDEWKKLIIISHSSVLNSDYYYAKSLLWFVIELFYSILIKMPYIECCVFLGLEKLTCISRPDQSPAL